MALTQIENDGPAISVVIPCRNEAAHIKTCVTSVLLQEAPPGGFEVIVADGESNDGTREILDSMAATDSRLRVIKNPRRITPCGMNCGIQASRGRWVAIMGSHNHCAPDYLVRCLEAAHSTGADNIGGVMFTEASGRVQKAIAAAHHSRFSVGGACWHDPSYEGPADTVFGGFYRRDVFDRIGMFDEELVRNQDDEFNLRLTRAGGRIWQSPRVKSWYQPRASLPALFRQYKQYGYWKVRVIQKHKLPASWRHVVPGAFLVVLMTLGLLSIFCFTAAWLAGWSLQPGLICAVGLLACLACYFAAAISASIVTSLGSSWSLLPLLPFVFLCYHWGYGYGFLRGIWDFVLRSKRPGRQFVELTRPEPAESSFKRR